MTQVNWNSIEDELYLTMLNDGIIVEPVPEKLNEESRKLATLRIIKSIEPIEGADFIEIAKVDGWQCIVKKGEFEVGHLAVYFEIDSFLPIEEKYEFLRKSSYKKTTDGTEGFRLRTMKMRKQLSQGLLLPVGLFLGMINRVMGIDPGIEGVVYNKADVVGEDVTSILNVTKWDPPIPANLGGKVEGRKPHFFPKTDEERIQNLPKILNTVPGSATDLQYEATEKIDGTSLSFYRFNGEMGVCSRNYEISPEVDNAYTKAAKKYKLAAIVKDLALNSELSADIAIQGELAGQGIQSNPLGLEEQELFLFNVYLIAEGRYCTPKERDAYFSFFAKSAEALGAPMMRRVPSLYGVLQRPVLMSMDEILQAVQIKSTINPKVWAEGVVFKCEDVVHNNVMSFKAISNRYLLKHGD